MKQERPGNTEMSELYTEQLQEHLRIFETELPAYLPAAEGLRETVARAMTYACEAGGKRIRPVLTLEFAGWPAATPAGHAFCGGGGADSFVFAGSRRPALYG